MKLQTYLRACLWAGGLLIVVLLVAGTLWLTLAAAGDQAGSQGAKGVFLVGLVCLVLDLIVLIVMLAVAEITRPLLEGKTNKLNPIAGPTPMNLDDQKPE
jgi:hypothetical protein